MQPLLSVNWHCVIEPTKHWTCVYVCVCVQRVIVYTCVCMSGVHMCVCVCCVCAWIVYNACECLLTCVCGKRCNDKPWKAVDEETGRVHRRTAIGA